MEECNMSDQIQKCTEWALDIRNKIVDLTMGVGKKGVHIASALSLADIMAVLYGSVLKYDPNNGEDENRDYFILSKGHAYTALYATLCKAGYFSYEKLTENFMTDDGFAPVHPVKNLERGVEFSGGSLGTGVSYAVGKAYGLKLRNKSNKVYTVLGDGECNEGSVWEAMMSAAHLKLDNLTIIVDNNGLQQDGPTGEVMNLDIAKAAKGFGLDVKVINGNSVPEVYEALTAPRAEGKPLCIVAQTIKGKGVSFIENNNVWHHAFLNQKQYDQAKEELK